jgi:SHS2 domain-containing protein
VYRWVEHTSELELHIEAPTEAAVFADALAAFAELVTDDGSPDSERRQIEVRAEKRDMLLVEWLSELLYLAEVEGFVPERLTDLRLDDGGLHATVRGHCGEPRHLVKAVTLHRLALERAANGGWRAQVVLDV